MKKILLSFFVSLFFLYGEKVDEVGLNNEYNLVVKKIEKEREELLEKNSSLAKKNILLASNINQLKGEIIIINKEYDEFKKKKLLDEREITSAIKVINDFIKANSANDLTEVADQLLNDHKILLKDGDVFDSKGVRQSGKKLVLGPLKLFYNQDISGQFFEENAISLLASNNLINFEKIKIGEEFPIYFNSKVALKDNGKDSLFEHLKKGKVAMIPLVALALFATISALIKMLKLFGVVKKVDENVVIKIIYEYNKNGEEAALRLVKNLPAPLSAVFREAILHANLSKEMLEEILYERITLEIPKLENGLASLAVSATIAPLLGLLGTVTGMINTFDLITKYGGGNADILSSGISEALITTEVGLVIAIPSLLVHAILSKRVANAVATTQKMALLFVNHIKVRS